MGLLLLWKFRRLRKRMLSKGKRITGKVEQITDKFAVPFEYVQKNGVPKDLRPAIIISYQTEDGRQQTLRLRTDDKTPYEPVGREVVLRYLCENGRDIAIPEMVLLKNDHRKS